MPTILRFGSYRVSFFAADSEEPAHVHVKSGSKEAKYWLQPFVRLAKTNRFRPHELNEIQKVLTANRDLLMEAWNEYFRN